MSKIPKFQQIVQGLNLDKYDKIDNLLKVPKKDRGLNVAHTQAPIRDGVHQADLLFLPHDKKYKYALVVVDVATSHMDAEPLKTKDANEVRDALIKIYKRRYLKTPYRLEVDAGTEFKKSFRTYFNDELILRVKEPGRHRQQSVVETMNGTIAKLLFMRMYEIEEATGQVNSEWVEFLPQVVKEINKYLSHKAMNIDASEKKNLSKASGVAREILPIGTKVRVQLDNPIENITNKKLTGKFRKTDFRWKKKEDEITNVYLNPAKPPMYEVDGNDNVAYTRNK